MLIKLDTKEINWLKKKLIKSPKDFDRSKVGDASNYIKKISYDKNGEIMKNNQFFH